MSNFIQPAFVKLEQRVAERVEGLRNGLETRLERDEYLASCGRLAAFREVLEMCIQIEKDMS